jgi:P2 family phage contractile tail tube protein
MIKDVLRDFVLFNGADKQVGRIDSFKPPSLNRMIEEFRGAGMDGKMPIDMGMETMTASWTTSGIDRITYGGWGLMNGIRTTVSVRAAVVDPVTGIPKPVVHTMIGDLTVIEPSEYKPGERATLQTTMALIYYKLAHTIPGAPLIEIDVVNGVRIINGIDQLVALRAIVGR